MRYILILIISCFVLCFFSCSKVSQNPYTTQKLKENYKVVEIYKELRYRTKYTSEKSVKNVDTTISKLNNNLNKELANFSSDTIYKFLRQYFGDDKRKNYYEISPELQQEADKVICIMNKSRIKNNFDGTFDIVTTEKYGSYYGLCTDEKFFNEPIAGVCSGFAVSDSIVVTAGHCLNESNLHNTVFIFGFYMLSKDNSNLKISESEIYEPVRFIGRESEGLSGKDYAVIVVNKKIPQNRIAKIRSSGIIPDSESVFIAGYPKGIPIKIAAGAKVFDNNNSDFFTANITVYEGNSGSPVFNENDHLVEGILVTGGEDYEFVLVNNCLKSIGCPENIGDCYAPHILRISQILNLINKYK